MKINKLPQALYCRNRNGDQFIFYTVNEIEAYNKAVDKAKIKDKNITDNMKIKEYLEVNEDDITRHTLEFNSIKL